MPAPQTISVDLNQTETDFIWDFVQTEFPNITGLQVVAKLEEAAKEGIRKYVEDMMEKHHHNLRTMNLRQDKWYLAQAFSGDEESATP